MGGSVEGDGGWEAGRAWSSPSRQNSGDYRLLDVPEPVRERGAGVSLACLYGLARPVPVSSDREVCVRFSYVSVLRFSSRRLVVIKAAEPIVIGTPVRGGAAIGDFGT